MIKTETSSSPPRSIKGVLFDLDGTLVDSEYLSPLTWCAVLREIGVKGISEASLEEALAAPALRGANASTIAEHLLHTFQIAYEDDIIHLVKRKRALAVEMATSGEVDLKPLWFDGVATEIQKLEQNLGSKCIGLCTSNLGSIAAATVDAGGLGDSFAGGRTVQEDVIDETTGLPQIKPLPNLYLLALEKLNNCSNLPSRDVAAVEDSVVGVTAAKAAGVGTILGVLNRKDNSTSDATEAREALLAAGADIVFDTTVAAIDYCMTNSDVTNQTTISAMDEDSILREKESVVRRYFQGVNEKDPEMMASCFAPEVQLCDMCGPSRGQPRVASSTDMADRCMEFLAAHPDCVVQFEHGPVCDREGKWVWCHWFEKGTWSGESRGIPPKHTKLDVGGHTRFMLEKQHGKQKIVKQVVFRTFSEWELSL